MVSLSGSHEGLSLSQLPAALYAVAFLFPLLLVPLQEFMKIRDKKHYLRYQRKIKLLFNTKLGMHSPV